MDTLLQLGIIGFYASGALAVITTVIWVTTLVLDRRAQKPLQTTIDWTPSRSLSPDTPQDWRRQS